MQKKNRLLYLLALLKFILPFLLQNGIYEPHRDEFLYLAEGSHMDWGYMEVPPLLSVFSWVTHLLGDGMFWIKFWPSLFGAFTYILAGKIILSLGGKSFALLLAAIAFIFGYMRTHFLFQGNFLEIFFYTLISYGLIRYIQTDKNKWLYVCSLGAGLGMLSKYSIGFFIVSVLIGLALTKQRKIFLNKHIYYAGLLTAVIFLPNLIWQASHHFPVAHHMKELQEKQLQYVNPWNFLLDQLLMFLSCFYIWLSGLLFVGATKRGRDYLFFCWTYIFLIILLLAFRGKSYYPQAIYATLFAFGSYRLEALTVGRFKKVRYVFIIISLGIGLFTTPISLPIFSPQKLADYYKKMNLGKSGVLKWEDQKNHLLPMDFADMLGWKEMTQKTAIAYQHLDSIEKRHCILFCDNYGEAGAVNYYGKNYKLPEALSDDASFLYWIPDSLQIDNMILVTDDKEEMQHSFIRNFTSAVVADSITYPYAREKGSLIIVFKGANQVFNQLFRNKLEKDRAALR